MNLKVTRTKRKKARVLKQEMPTKFLEARKQIEKGKRFSQQEKQRGKPKKDQTNP